MKLSKLALALSTLVCLGGVFIVSGCKLDESLGGDSDGNKWELKVTVDATADAEDISDKTWEEEGKTVTATNKRYYKQISKTSKVAGIETEISVNMSNKLKNSDATSVASGSTNLATSGYSAIGYIFGYNDNAENKDNKDFYILGIKPAAGPNGVYYLEKYTGVTKKNAETTGWNNASSMGVWSSYIGYGATNATSDSPSKDETAIKTAPEKTTDDDGNEIWTYKIAITQDVPGTYVVKLNGEVLATISGDTHTVKIDGDENYVAGDVCAYAMARDGHKVEATYTVNKKDKSHIIGSYNMQSTGEEFTDFDLIVLE